MSFDCNGNQIQDMDERVMNKGKPGSIRLRNRDIQELFDFHGVE